LTFAVCSPIIRDVSDQKEKTAILVSASIIAAVRLAREPIKNSPKINATIEDSLQLARMIWAKIAPDR
jgi:hypothetical protein